MLVPGDLGTLGKRGGGGWGRGGDGREELALLQVTDNFSGPYDVAISGTRVY